MPAEHFDHNKQDHITLWLSHHLITNYEFICQTSKPVYRTKTTRTHVMLNTYRALENTSMLTRILNKLSVINTSSETRHTCIQLNSLKFTNSAHKTIVINCLKINSWNGTDVNLMSHYEKRVDV